MINAAGQAIIRKSESLRLTAYLCPAGVPTIGWGHTRTVTHEDVRIGKRITRAEAERLFQADMEEFESYVLAACTLTPNENQLAAMVSLAFNIGMGWTGAKKPKGAKDGFLQSTVLRAHNRGDFDSAARAFALWNKATVDGRKVALPGLTLRRAEESALYLRPIADGLPAPAMPQAVEPEPSLRQSTIIQGGAATAAASGLGLAAEAARSVADIRYSLGDWLPIVFGVLVIAAAAYIIYERVKQRREGRA